LLGSSRVCRNSHGRIGGRSSPCEQIFLGRGAVAGLPYKSVKDLCFLWNEVHGIYFAIHTPYRTEFHNFVAVYHDLDTTTPAVVHVGIYLFLFIHHVIDAFRVAIHEHPV